MIALAALAYLAALAWFAHSVAVAPMGHEDEGGYHNDSNTASTP